MPRPSSGRCSPRWSGPCCGTGRSWRTAHSGCWRSAFCSWWAARCRGRYYPSSYPGSGCPLRRASCRCALHCGPEDNRRRHYNNRPRAPQNPDRIRGCLFRSGKAKPAKRPRPSAACFWVMPRSLRSSLMIRLNSMIFGSSKFGVKEHPCFWFTAG